MKNIKLKSLVGFVVMLAGTFAPLTIAMANNSAGSPEFNFTRAADLPTLPCTELEVEEGNKLAYHVYARGVQIYKWNGVSWSFVGPVATLYADAGYHAQVGTHYAGPTWESNSGSFVKAARQKDCTPDPNSIAWLLLKATTKSGPGIFGSVTFIQRVNTTGGTAPSGPGSSIGAIVEVPYTAEYYFYRAQD